MGTKKRRRGDKRRFLILFLFCGFLRGEVKLGGGGRGLPAVGMEEMGMLHRDYYIASKLGDGKVDLFDGGCFWGGEQTGWDGWEWWVGWREWHV